MLLIPSISWFIPDESIPSPSIDAYTIPYAYNPMVNFMVNPIYNPIYSPIYSPYNPILSQFSSLLFFPFINNQKNTNLTIKNPSILLVFTTKPSASFRPDRVRRVFRPQGSRSSGASRRTASGPRPRRAAPPRRWAPGRGVFHNRARGVAENMGGKMGGKMVVS